MKKTFKDLQIGDKVYELVMWQFTEAVVESIDNMPFEGVRITTSTKTKWDNVMPYNSCEQTSSTRVLFSDKEEALKYIQNEMDDLHTDYKQKQALLKKVQQDILCEIKTISNVQVGDKVWVIADTMVETATITNMCGCVLTIKNPHNKLLQGGLIFDFKGVKEDATYICRFSHASVSSIYCFFNLQGATDHLNNKAKSLREQADFFENKAKILK